MRFILSFLIFTVFLMSTSLAQSFQESTRLMGYEQTNDEAYFVFDPSIYQIENPQQVVLTGSFRSWSTDMDDSAWHLQQRKDGLWFLGVENPDFKQIPPQSEFKFRVNEGTWLSPPSSSPNEKNGNLVFLHEVALSRLRAEIRRPYTIWASVEGGKRPLKVEDYRLLNSQGQEIPIAGVMPNTAQETLIRPTLALDIRRVYYLEIPDLGLRSHCSFDGWFREIYSPKELGATVSQDKKETTFRVFAPRATALKLYLYRQSEDTEAYESHELEVDSEGVWEISLAENLHGVYYDFTVHGFQEKGNQFYESHPQHISDPYARVSVDTWGKCRVWEKTRPASPLAQGRPALEEVIAYEVHVQDFTDLLPVADAMKGRLPAMTQKGLKNKFGKSIGFDYLVDLGINTVHLMPVQEYLHWPDEDWKASFQSDPYMQENGIAEENYQWGYRTSHCFAVESRFRQKNTEPGAERDQFRDLVQAFHDQNIAVIIDIVPNHTAENMDGQALNIHFNALDKQYYYRTQDLEHIGEYGNEVKTENRPMVQRWLIDQCRHWIEEFGIDGFRIDLAGQIDQQTLIALREALGEDIIIYGEPWIGSNDPDFEANPDWDWYKKDSPITFFQDEARNAFKGPVFNLKDPKKDRGFPGGNVKERENVKKGLMNTFPEEKSPLSGINYLDIHDNWALADQFAKEDWDGRLGVEEEQYKLAALLLFTSQGPLVLHGGSEMMRSKGEAVLKEVVKETNAGIKVYLHGKRDTYNMRRANQFKWDNLGDPKAANRYENMYTFWRGLIALRSSESGKIFRNAQALPEDYYQFIEPKNLYLLGYTIQDRLKVLMNTSEEAASFKSVDFSEGTWQLIGTLEEVNHQKGVKDKGKLNKIKGGQSLDIRLAPKSFKMWIKK